MPIDSISKGGKDDWDQVDRRDLCDLSGPRWEFVNGFASLSSQVAQGQHFSRFQFWNDSFAYWRSIAALECTWQRYEDAATHTRNLTTPDARHLAAKTTLLPLRVTLIEVARTMMTHLVQSVSDPGDLGTLTTVVTESVLAETVPGGYPSTLDGPSGMILGRHTDELTAWLGHPLPAEAMPQLEYSGRARVFMPTVRTIVEKDEALRLSVVVCATADVLAGANVTLQHRKMGVGQTGNETVMVQETQGRGVFVGTLEAISTDTEWLITVVLPGSTRLFVPASAPTQWQSVVVMPSSSPQLKTDDNVNEVIVEAKATTRLAYTDELNVANVASSTDPALLAELSARLHAAAGWATNTTP